MALAVGVDKMVVSDKRLMFSIFDGAWDVHDVKAGTDRLLSLGVLVIPPAGIKEQEKDHSLWMYMRPLQKHICKFLERRSVSLQPRPLRITHIFFEPIGTIPVFNEY